MKKLIYTLLFVLVSIVVFSQAVVRDKPQPKKYKYFVSYVFTKASGQYGYGNATISFSEPINSEALEELKSALQNNPNLETKSSNVIILNFILLPK